MVRNMYACSGQRTETGCSHLPALSKGPLLAVLPSWLTHRLPESLLFILSISDSGVLGLWMLTLQSPAFVWVLRVEIQVHTCTASTFLSSGRILLTVQRLSDL